MTLSTSRTRATFCSPCRNVNPVTGLCKGYPGAIVRPYQTPLSTHSSLFQSSFSKPSPMIMEASLHGIRKLKKSWECLRISANRIVPGSAVQLKTAMAGYASTCRAKPNSATTQIKTFRTSQCFTTTPPENVSAIELHWKQCKVKSTNRGAALEM